MMDSAALDETGDSTDKRPLLLGESASTDASINAGPPGGAAQDGDHVTSLRDVAWLALAFLFLFSAFTVTQNLASSIFVGQVGFWSLGTLYIVFAVVNLVASSITRALGLKWALFLGASTYVWYVVANVIAIRNGDSELVQYAVMIPSAALLGAGAATIWTAQGAYVTYCSSTADLGTANGLFFFIFMGNQILGNVGAAVLFTLSVKVELVFEILAGAGGLGLLLFLWLRAVERAPAPKSLDDVEPPSRWHTLLEVVMLMGDWRMVALIPLIVYSGITQTFFAGNIPLFINDYKGDGKCTQDLAIKLYVMACLGLAASLGSLAFGKLSDRLGRLPVLGLAGVLQLVAYFLLYLIDPRNRLEVLIPTAVLLGLGDAIINTQSYGILGFLFRDRSEAAFATFKFFQSGATGVLFFLSAFLVVVSGTCQAAEQNSSPAMDVWLPVLLVALGASVVGLGVLRWHRAPIDAVST